MNTYTVKKDLKNSILQQVGYTKESLQTLQEKTDAAIIMCGGYLGDCYLMAEVIDWILTNGLYTNIKKSKWFKRGIKYNINQSIESLRKTISNSRHNSPTNPEYMMAMADSMYDELKIDLEKLNNSILLELNKYKVKDAHLISRIILVDILLQWVADYYDRTIEHMISNICNKVNYNNYYGPARLSYAVTRWTMAVSEIGYLYIDDEIDLNKSDMIKNGIAIIDKKMQSPELADKLKNLNSDIEEGKGFDLYSKALKTLNVV